MRMGRVERRATRVRRLNERGRRDERRRDILRLMIFLLSI